MECESGEREECEWGESVSGARVKWGESEVGVGEWIWARLECESREKLAEEWGERGVCERGRSGV